MSEPERSKEELIEFLNVLRRSGFKISTEQYVSAHHLLCAMAAHGDWPDARSFGLMLAPLLCSTREEQDSFPRYYQQWLTTRPALFRKDAKRKSFSTPAPEPAIVPDAKGSPWWRPLLNRWRGVPVLGIAAVVVLVFLSSVIINIYMGSSPSNPQVVVPAPTPGNTNPSESLLARLSGPLTWVGIALGVAWILILITRRVLRYTRQLGLKKWHAREHQRVKHLNVIGAADKLLGSLPLRRVAQEMRRHRPFDETDLDVSKTIEETIRMGVFTPAFTLRKALPEYLVLIDRAGTADQQAQLVDGIVNQLSRNDVPIERYFFQEDPRICRKDGPKAQLQTLQELALQYPRHFMLIFSDGAGFFNPLTGRPHRWLEAFASWNTRLLLTSEVQRGDYRDWVLNELGFRVLPAGKAGLAAINESLDGGTSRRSNDSLLRTPLPPLLHERQGHWLKSHPPRAELIVELCSQLKDFLGDDGYYWLSACAAYPLLYLDLTFYLGERLTPQEDLFETYSKLVRLPWFRSGSMPDWLRAHLILELDETKEFAIRSALEDLLIGSLKHPEGFLLPIVTEPKPDGHDGSGFFRRNWAKLTGKVRALDRSELAVDILKSQLDDNRVRDYVAVTFMSGGKPSKLAVKIPRELYPVLYPSGPPVIDRLMRVTILVITLLASSFLLLPVFSNNLILIAGSVVVWAFFIGLNVWAVRELNRGDQITADPLSSAVIEEAATQQSSQPDIPRSDAVQQSDNLASDRDTRYRLLQRRWFIPAATAAVLFLVSMMLNRVAADISLALGPYQNWIWVLSFVSLLVAIIAAISEQNRKDKPSELLGGMTMVNANVVSSVADKPVVRMPEVLNFLHEIPPPPPDFTGRVYELEELLASIEGSGVTISGLQGMGGIGKTALALKLAERLKPRYPDAQFFLDLKGASAQPLTVAEALAHVVRAYYPTAKLPESESELRGLYLSVLKSQRALLLMDNAASAEQVEPLIPPPGCLLLVTSRQHITVPGLVAKNLDTLSAADARKLLLTIAPRIEPHAEEIAELCGYLPLALRLAAAVMVRYRNLSPADYVRRLRERQQRLQLIDASLSLSYELLIEELRQLWRWLAVFPDTFAVDAAAAVWEVEVDHAKYILGELIATSMVEWNESSDRYRLHDLARLFADAKLSAEERALGQKRFAMHYKNVLVAARNQYLEGGESLLHGLALFDLEWSNIDAGHAWVSAQTDTADVDVVELSITYPDAGAYVLSLRQHPRELLSWLETALAAARRLKDRRSEGRLLGNIGLVYADLGETRRAIKITEQRLEISREVSDRRGEGNALHTLGYAYSDLGDYPRAIKFNEQSLMIAREIGDRRSEAVALRYLGLEYAALGDYHRAIQFNEQSLVIAREIGDRRGEGNALGSLGSAYASLGETQRALQFNEQWLVIARELGDRRAEGEGLFNVGLILNQLGDRSKAIAHAETALEILDQIESPRAKSVREQLSQWRNLT